jgi:hypothetical protein
VIVVPWGNVLVDGEPVTSSERIPLSPGSHKLIVEHPDYEPVPRTVRITAGKKEKIVVDLPEEAVKKRR